MVIENENCVDMLKEELNNSRKLQLTVYGDSMQPTLQDGQRIMIEKCDRYKIGDVVAYYMIVDNKLKIVVHRVVFARKTYVLTKGDNNSFIDPIRIPIENIIGISK